MRWGSPGTARSGAGDLVTRGWTGTGAVVGDVPVASLDVASSVLWVTVAGVMFSRLFRWDPRR
jgi:hypothetical protein